MIKLSDMLIATLDDKDPLIALQINEVKRLEALDVPRVEAERKPLVDEGGDVFYFIIDGNGVNVGWQTTRWDADTNASHRTKKTGLPHTVCQVMAPVNGECPTIPVATFTPTPERPHEWVIYWDSESGEGSDFGLNGVVWFIDHKHHCVRRFATAAEAQDYIDENGITDAYPWPVPKMTN